MPRVIPAADEGALAEARGELIPEDDYWDVLIERVTEKQSKSAANPGKPMYEVMCRILDDGPAKGRVITKTVCLWYEARFALIQLNKSIGLEVTAVDPETGLEGLNAGDPWDYEGQHTAIRVKHENTEAYGEQAKLDRFLDQSKAHGSNISAANGGAKKPAGKITLPPRPAKTATPRPTRGAPVLGTPPALDAVLTDADQGTALLDQAADTPA